LKGDHPRTIPAKCGLIWLSGFKGEDLNVKGYDVQRADDGCQVMAKAHMAQYIIKQDNYKKQNLWKNQKYPKH
jgi:hypothetical protein